MAAGKKLTPAPQADKYDIKKSSYYVWFLGAKESRGLRGEEYIHPVVRYLTNKEKEVEPIKVTLQVSNKGIKIIQNMAPKRVPDSYRDTVKHFIPHHAITCAVQGDKRGNMDIISTILLIYNPATACPVHVHTYRCDSPETASHLMDQLNALIERPENQKKFQEIETRLQEKGLLQRHGSSAASSRLGSDGFRSGSGGRGGSGGGGTAGSASDSGAGSDKGSQLTPPNTIDNKIASMYDSLAAELREKLGGRGPLLLPPRDYDTMHRSHGNVDIGGIDERRCLNPRAVCGGKNGARNGPTTTTTSPTGRNGHQHNWGEDDEDDDDDVVVGGGGRGVADGAANNSCGQSSGIGSDSASSPVQEASYSHQLDDRSSSDDEWPDSSNQRLTNGDSLFLVDSAAAWLQPDPAHKSLSSRFNPAKQKKTTSPSPSPPADGENEDARERFRGAKQLFLSLERKREKDKTDVSPTTNGNARVKADDGIKNSGHKAANERQRESAGRWSRFDRIQPMASKNKGHQQDDLGGLSAADHAIDSRWPKSDRDTGYVSRYSRDKSRSRDLSTESSSPSNQVQHSAPAVANNNNNNLFTKSGKKSSQESKDKYTAKKLSRFLSRETLESDGYDRIEEFDEPDEIEAEAKRNKVKRQPSRTSLKLDMRSAEEGFNHQPPPRRGMLRREVTELDMKGYLRGKRADDLEFDDRHEAVGGFGKKFLSRNSGGGGGGLFGRSQQRALSPSPAGGRFPFLGGGGGSRERAKSPVVQPVVRHSPYRGEMAGNDGSAWPPSPQRAFSPTRRGNANTGADGEVASPGHRYQKHNIPSDNNNNPHVRGRSASRGPFQDRSPQQHQLPAANNIGYSHQPTEATNNSKYPSMDMRHEKRKSMYFDNTPDFGGGGGLMMSRGADYRRRSYHELSDIDRLDGGGHHAFMPPSARNFQHSGRKVAPPMDVLASPHPHHQYGPPIGLVLPPVAAREIRSYKQLAESHRYPGLDRENSRFNLMHQPQPQTTHSPGGPYNPHNAAAGGFRGGSNGAVGSGPFDRPAMYRHSYADPSPGGGYNGRHHSGIVAGRFGLASLKPY